MAEGVENLMLEQLRLIRDDLRRMDQGTAELRREMREGFDETKAELHGLKMMIFGLSTVIGHIDTRVAHLETKMGIDG